MGLEGMIEKIVEFEGSDVLSYMVRGHVDKRAFVNEVKREFNDIYTEDFVQHGFARLVPAGRDMPGQMIIIVCERGRGAFPVTTIDLLLSQLLQTTAAMDEHPAGYNGPCMCQVCQRMQISLEHPFR